MPIQVNKLEIEVTAVGTTVTLPVTDPFDLYTVVTSGSVTIVGTTDIVTSGTLVDGLKYIFKYTGTVTNPAALTFMGEALPGELADKECTIEAYYNGTTWELTFLPDTSQEGILTPDSLSQTSNTGVDFVYNAVATANIGGEQLLQTLEIPANTFSDIGDAFKVTIWGVCSNNPAELKTISVKSITGATTILLYVNDDVEDLIGRFQIEVLVTLVNNGTGQIAPTGYMITEGATADVDNYMPNVLPTGFDFINGIQYINVYGEEQTPSGSQITVRGMRIEKSLIA